jgi:CRP-like cAMP-binding protein
VTAAARPPGSRGGVPPNARAVDRRKLLAGISIFASLGEADLDRLLTVTTTRRLGPREPLFGKGDPGSALYGVLSGRLKVTSAGTDGKEVVFGLCDPGEVIGEIALLDGSPRSAAVVALEPSELLVLHRRDFLPFLARHPAVAIQLAEVLAARLRRISELTEDTLFLGLPSRLAKKLLALAASYGRATPDGVRIELRLPQHELGELVGTSRESINKQLRAWQRDGLVAAARGTVTLRDPAALQDIARLTVL